MKKALFLIALLIALAGSESYAQSMGSSYRTALGVKFWPGAISFKHFIQQDRAIEGLASFWTHGFRVTALYEIHGDINGAEGLKWYVGPGLHIGAYNETWYRHDRNDIYENGDPSFGIDGVLGLDYKIPGAPINLSLDIQPYLEVLRHPYLDTWGGLGIRYTF